MLGKPNWGQDGLYVVPMRPPRKPTRGAQAGRAERRVVGEGDLRVPASVPSGFPGARANRPRRWGSLPPTCCQLFIFPSRTEAGDGVGGSEVAPRFPRGQLAMSLPPARPGSEGRWGCAPCAPGSARCLRALSCPRRRVLAGCSPGADAPGLGGRLPCCRLLGLGKSSLAQPLRPSA